MVIRTEICSFSEARIYPGRGQKFIAKDGRGFIYLTKKNKCLSLRKVITLISKMLKNKHPIR